MVDPIVTAIASALAGKAADAVAAGARASWAALVRLVRERLAEDDHADEAARAATVVDANGDVDVGALAQRLGELAASDPRFKAELCRLWAEVVEAPDRRAGVVNRNHGTAHVLVQAGEIQGSVHFGGCAPPEADH